MHGDLPPVAGAAATVAEIVRVPTGRSGTRQSSEALKWMIDWRFCRNPGGFRYGDVGILANSANGCRNVRRDTAIGDSAEQQGTVTL